MKIVVVSGFDQSLVNFRGPLLAALVSAGHEVIACAPGKDKDVIACLAQLGVTYRDISLSRTGSNPVTDLRTVLCLFKLLWDIRPQIIFTYNHKPVIYGSLAAWIVGVSERFSLISGLGTSFYSRVTLRRRMINAFVLELYRLSLTKNRAVFFQNPDDLARFVEPGLIRDPTRAVLINGSGVDLNHFHEVAPLTEKLVFLLVARLNKEKGIIEYIEAARMLKTKYKCVTFRLLGPFDYSYPSSCIREKQVKDWQREGIIEYLGETKDVRPFIADASVFVLPSYGEGTPRSTLEAMAMGRPVITTDTPGCRETVVDGENGFLVPARDVTALIDAMEKFIMHPDLVARMGRLSRKIAVEKYDVHKVNAVIMKTMGLSANKINTGLGRS